MSEDKTLTQIPHFDGHYDHWSEMMENLLRAKGLSGIIEKGIGEPVDNAALTEHQRALLDEVRTKAHQVKHYLFQALDREVFEKILDRRSSKIIWDSMKKKFGGNQRVMRTTCNALRREFNLLEMKKGETINEYLEKVTQVANKLRSNGEVMLDSKIVEKVLSTLTDQFTYVSVSIEESANIDKLSVDKLQSILTMHEQKFKRFQKEADDQVLKVEDRYGSSSRGRGRNSFRRSRGGGRQSFNKSAIECYKCHKMGHFQYECSKWNKEAHYTAFEEEDDLLLMAQTDQSSEENDEDCRKSKEQCMQATTKDITILWHQRLGHLNYKSLCNLQCKKMVHGLLEFKNDNFSCIDWLNGKQTRIVFPKEATWRASKLLELVHSDLCGPISPISSSGKRYFILFIDHYSRKCWIYLLENKSDAFTHFKYFKSMVETDVNAKIKCLRTDKGGEFNSTDFDEFCKTMESKGI
ncbi:hypothetical protein LIER_17103 [Lithospermum erythrorhizon]|uniref:Retrovirus-related Pol polyprotein from transposon TNT 1-94 n=1 Tax=Lithospermum erythrorhizon TaxID=34254 RepID=A0AAV3Q945_LITER